MRLATGLRPDPLGSYSAPPDPLAVIRGGEGREGKGRGRKGRGRKDRGKEGRGGEGKGKGKGERKGHSNPPPSKKSGYGPVPHMITACR